MVARMDSLTLRLMSHRANGVLRKYKMHTPTSAAIGSTEKITTAELAKMTRDRSPSIRTALSRTGHYLGLRPVKLPNGRLLWDAAAVDKILNGGVTA